MSEGSEAQAEKKNEGEESSTKVEGHKESQNASLTETKTVGNGAEGELGEEVPMTFPQKLIEILSNKSNEDIIGWLDHGKGFMIYKKKKFAADLLPTYFKQAKFTSFTRKLNRWGFTRITRGPETGAYYHRFFLRDEPRMCLQMSCQNVRHFPPEGAGATGNAHDSALTPGAVGLPYGTGGGGLVGMNMLGSGVGGPLGAGAGANMDMQQLIQQQALFQRMQLEQLQKQQHIQANELVRRAMATQLSASATQAQLQAMTDALLGGASAIAASGGAPTGGDSNGGGGGAINKQPGANQSSLLSSLSDGSQTSISQLSTTLAQQPSNSLPDNNLYAQLLHAKASQMSAKPLLMAMQNGLLGGLGGGIAGGNNAGQLGVGSMDLSTSSMMGGMAGAGGEASSSGGGGGGGGAGAQEPEKPVRRAPSAA